MEEDDSDFTPSQSSSNNLASLFGFNKKPLQGNTSLTYTAPKAPKRDSSPSKSQPTEGKSNKGIIIYSKAVQAYKLENRKYVNQGLAGIVISGNYDSLTYLIILYNHAKQHIANVTIAKTFTLTLSANNYVSFYDNKRQNWSIMFQSSNDVEQFVEKVAISKFYCQPGPSESILIQDLSPALNTLSSSNSTVEITYSSYNLSPQSVSIINENVKDKIDLTVPDVILAKGLIGCHENTVRLILTPHSLGASWIKNLGADKDLLLRIKIEKIMSQVECSLMSAKSTGDNIDSPLDSSTEEVNEQTKAVSMKNAIASTKTQKANLISRIARMGQATLPLKQGLNSGQSDSEDDPVPISPKPRTSRGRSFAVTPHQGSDSYSSARPVHEVAKQLSVYQNDLSLQQMQLAKYGVPHQVVPVSTSPVVSPSTDPSFSVYVSESRIQAAELRMNISKISDKVDTVLNKIQSLTISKNDSNLHSPIAQDSTGILSGVQNLIAENERLRLGAEEQKKKLEQQNDRIFQLLELNQKYLEQNSTTMEKQSDTEIKLKNELEKLLEKDTQAKEDSKKLKEKMNDLKNDFSRAEEDMKKLKEENDKLIAELESYKKVVEDNNNMRFAVENYEGKLGKASEIVTKLKEKLKESLSENERLKGVIETQREDMKSNKNEMQGTLKTKCEEYEQTVRILQKKLSEDETRYELAIQDLNNAVMKLEEQNKSLLLDLKTEKEKQKNDVSADPNQFYFNLTRSFTETEYSSSTILSIIENCFKKTSVGAEGFEVKTQTLEFGDDIAPVPELKSTIQNIKIVTQGDETNQTNEANEEANLPSTQTTPKKEISTKKDVLEDEAQKNKKEGSYNKSYDQRWRTTKPPPPPLFDDEDEDDWLN